MSVFADRVSSELLTAREGHPTINSLHEGYAVILEELDEFKAEVWKKSYQRNPLRIFEELVQIAAMAQRVAEDVVMTHDRPIQ